MNNPKLRFKADDGSDFSAWKEKKICDVSVSVRVGFVGTCEPYYTDESGIRLYRTGNIGERGLSENDMKYVTTEFHEKNKKSQLCKWDILIARHGESGRAVLFDKEQPANCLNIVIIRPDLVYNNPYFLCACMNTPFVNKQVWKAKAGSTQSVINTGEVENLKVFIPSLPEQKKIASFLSTIDEIITTTQLELTAWQERKKGVMQKIFNREVRFKADDGSEFPEWEEKRLGEVFVERSERSTDNLDLLSVTIANGVIRQNESDKRNVSSVDKSNYKRVYVGDLAYNSMRMWQGAEGVSAYDGIVSPAYTVLVPKKQEYIYFYEYMFKRTEMLHIFQRYSQGLTSDTWNLKYPVLAHISVVVPSFPEQKKIADCLSSLDDVINQIQAELSAWKEFKKGLLQQMFV